MGVGGGAGEWWVWGMWGLGMATQINDIHDLLRLPEERPDLAAELRQRI